jgi:hypothetical protein
MLAGMLLREASRGWLALLAAGALLAGCAGEGPPAAPSQAPEAGLPLGPPGGAGAARAPTDAGRRDPGRWLAPDWPEGWRVVEDGVVGSESLPVVWFRIEAGAMEPLAAARSALAALRPLAGDVALEQIEPPPAGTEETVGQLRGRRLAAVVTARRAEGVTAVHVSAEMTPAATP